MNIFKALYSTSKIDDETIEVKKNYTGPFIISLLLVGVFYFFYYYSFNAINSYRTVFITTSFGATLLFSKRLINNHLVVANSFIAIYSSSLIALSYFSGGINSHTIWWFPSIALISSLLINNKATLIWSFIILANSLCLYFFTIKDKLPVNEMIHINMSQHNIISLFSLLLLVAVLSSLADYLRELTLAEKNEHKAKAIRNSNLASLGEMASGMAHEINNPLMIIITTITVIKKMVHKNKLDPEKLKNHLDNIEKTSHRATAIIKGLKNLSRDGVEDERAIFAIGDLIKEVFSFSEGCFKRNSIKFSFNTSDSNLNTLVCAQRVQLGQVILNLLTNASDAILENCKDEEKWIKIELNKVEGYLTMSLTDSGKGISQELQEKIFNPFFTTKELGKGTGLGLSLCHTIMEKNMGALYIDNNCKNTRFIIQIPLSEQAQLTKAA